MNFIDRTNKGLQRNIIHCRHFKAVFSASHTITPHPPADAHLYFGGKVSWNYSKKAIIILILWNPLRAGTPWGPDFLPTYPHTPKAYQNNGFQKLSSFGVWWDREFIVHPPDKTLTFAPWCHNIKPWVLKISNYSLNILTFSLRALPPPLAMPNCPPEVILCFSPNIILCVRLS